MKKIISIVLFTAVALSAGAQKRSESPKAVEQRKDSVPAAAPLTDSTAVLSFRDVQQFDAQVVQELPAKYADVIRQWWVQRLQQVAAQRKK